MNSLESLAAPSTLKRTLVAFVLLLMISSCAVFGKASKTGKVWIKYDSVTRLCDMKIDYQGEQYRQTFVDESNVNEYHENLWISIPKKPFLENDTEYYGYFIFGGCMKEILIGDTESLIEYLLLGFNLPSTDLVHDGKNIVAGLSPEQLVRKGFSITTPIESDGPRYTSMPEVFEDRFVKINTGLLQLTTSAGSVAGIKKGDVTCTGNFITILGGTLTVPAGTSEPTERAKSNELTIDRYEVLIDNWEFAGTVTGTSC